MKYTLLLILAIAATHVSAADWPQFHGPNRNNKSPDKGLLKTWPEGGPSRIWEASGIGEGYSTVAIVGKRIYTAGAIDHDCVITALDMNGKKVWTRTNGKAWKGSYPGTRSTPTITDGLLYHLSGIGNLICLKADSGDVVWTVNILEKFGGRNIIWGLAESPLVIGDEVICTPGGKNVSMVALDRKTGEVVWQCTGAGDKPGYASPILIEYQGLKQIVTPMSESIVTQGLHRPEYHNAPVSRRFSDSLRLCQKGNDFAAALDFR
jgi:outer membrane protein assembly factor BamB